MYVYEIIESSSFISILMVSQINENDEGDYDSHMMFKFRACSSVLAGTLISSNSSRKFKNKGFGLYLGLVLSLRLNGIMGIVIKIMELIFFYI